MAAGRETEQQDRPQSGARQVGPGGRGEHVAGQAEQRIERRMTVRFFTRERPEPCEDLRVEEQLRPRVELVASGRRRLPLL